MNQQLRLLENKPEDQWSYKRKPDIDIWLKLDIAIKLLKVNEGPIDQDYFFFLQFYAHLPKEAPHEFGFDCLNGFKNMFKK